MKKERIPTSQIAPFGLRMQEDLRYALEEASRLNGRSLNAEIIARLEATIKPIHAIERSSREDPLTAAYFAADAIEEYLKVVRMSVILTKLRQGDTLPAHAERAEPGMLTLPGGEFTASDALSASEKHLVEQLRNLSPEMQAVLDALAGAAKK